ncbi:MAG: IS21 family transposase, partial [Ktedonobacterales bacterium]
MARRRIGVADIKAVLVAWEAGQSVSAIARMLGYTRPTVRRYIEAARRLLGLQVALGQERRPVAGLRRRTDLEWEAIAQTVQERLARHRPAGAAAAEVAQHHAYLERTVGQVALTVLHQRLRDERGLQVSWGTFYRYARAHWPERSRRSGVQTQVTIRLADPPPGDEAQVDFFYVGRWTDPGSGRTFRLSAFLMTLSASRHLFLYPVVREDEQTWLEAHVAAFTFFGGVPRRLVPDNLTAAIVKADRYDPRLNRAYSELARYYGCLVDPARVAHPKDKPRVERSVAYARASFFRGRTFTSLEQMRREAVHWARTVAGQRVHGTTGEHPLVVFEAREQAALLPLPPAPWELARWVRATVHADCHLNAGGARYSVPYRSIGRTLDVRLGQRTVAIYDGAELLTTHLRQARGHATRLEHYPQDAQAFVRATPAVCQARAAQVGPATAAVVEPLLASRTLHQLREVQALLRLVELYTAPRLEAACARALAVGDARLRTVRGLLERGLDRLDAQAPEP